MTVAPDAKILTVIQLAMSDVPAAWSTVASPPKSSNAYGVATLVPLILVLTFTLIKELVEDRKLGGVCERAVGPFPFADGSLQISDSDASVCRNVNSHCL